MRALALVVVGVLVSCGRTEREGNLPEATGGDAQRPVGGQTSGGAPHTGSAPSSDGGKMTGGSTAIGGSATIGGTGMGASGIPLGGEGSDGGAPGHPTGGNGQSLCPGVPAVCEPNLRGCADRGEAYLCSSCGEIEPLGQACGRLLVSDKEGGLVCVVHGENQLTCAGGATEWSSGFDFPIELEGAPRLLDLTDDSSSAIDNATLDFCWIGDTGGISCSQRFPQQHGSNCTDIALSDPPVLCSICDGDLKCDGEPSPVPGVREIVASDSQPFWLENDGTAHFQLDDFMADFLPGNYEQLFVDDNLTPCGIREGGTLVCSSTNLDGTVFELEGDFVSGSAAGGRICLIERGGTLSCYRLHDGLFTAAFEPPGSGFVRVVTPYDKSCALTKAGSVVCWDDDGLLDEISAQLN